jgi:hypothetical protein
VFRRLPLENVPAEDESCTKYLFDIFENKVSYKTMLAIEIDVGFSSVGNTSQTFTLVKTFVIWPAMFLLRKGVKPYI